VRLIFRILLFMIGFSAVVSVLRGISNTLFGAAPRRPMQPTQPQQRTASASGHLVKDPVCGTYVLQESAIQAGNVFFCSEECRLKYRA